MKGHFKKRGCKCATKNCTCDKTWSVVIDIGKNLQTGKRQQKTLSGFKTKQEAENAVTALINEINHGTYFTESDISFKDFIDTWLLEYTKKVNPKESTLRLRNYYIYKLLPYFTYASLKDISKDLYQNAIDDLTQKGYSKSTLNGIHFTAKMLFNLATSKQLIKVNPTTDAYVQREQQKIIEMDEGELPIYFEKDELAIFLKTVKEKGLYLDVLIFFTLSYTGMRIGELVALKWRNIDFINNTISITKTCYNPKNNTKKYKLLPPKTKKSRRTIVVDEFIMSLFKTHYKEQQQLIKRMGKSYYNEQFVFTNTNKYPGYPVLIKQIANRMKRLLKLSGLTLNVTPHSLRHTHTSLLAEAGVDLDEIMERLGHQDDATTRNIYLHITSARKSAAAVKFSNLMNNISA